VLHIQLIKLMFQNLMLVTWLETFKPYVTKKDSHTF